MEIVSTPSATPTVNSTTAASQSEPTSDFDTFLRLLTAQIRNQDPLEPTDATQYTSQLATFSNVEQAVKTNGLLEQMIGRLDTQQLGSAANWIGMEVRHSGPMAHPNDASVVFTHINPAADRAEMVVKDAGGVEVARTPIDPDGTTAAWPPTGLADALPEGLYVMNVESWSGDRQLAGTTVDHYSKVQEVVFGSAGVELVLPGDMRLPSDGLQGIRRAEE